MKIKPQKGFQEKFAASSADIVIGGGAAGAGKTFALLCEPLRHHQNPNFSATIFRRTSPQIRNDGGLWDESSKLYPLLNAQGSEHALQWKFPSGSKVSFRHLQHEKDKQGFQGAQIPLIGWDELTHFTESQFFYLLSRNRSTCGVRPYIRATCNPDYDSWVRRFVEWWICWDEESDKYGLPIPERSGVIRYFSQLNGNYIWGDTRQEVLEKNPTLKKPSQVKSVTFIGGTLEGNKILTDADEGYEANLLALPQAEQDRLLRGFWGLRQDGDALCNFTALEDAFTNFLKPSPTKAITCDVAMEGRDVSVIMYWEGRWCKEIHAISKNKTGDLTDKIEELRRKHRVQKSQVIVDKVGVGTGVVHIGGYREFVANKSALPVNGKAENYANMKAQAAYRFADKLNAGEYSFMGCKVYVDGVESDFFGDKQVITLLKEDLRSFKRKPYNRETKLDVQPKANQKTVLGRSPDWGDCAIMLEISYISVKRPAIVQGYNV